MMRQYTLRWWCPRGSPADLISEPGPRAHCRGGRGDARDALTEAVAGIDKDGVNEPILARALVLEGRVARGRADTEREVRLKVALGRDNAHGVDVEVRR